MSEPVHSARYFTDARDHWWHDDFVALLARRFGIGSATHVLDVGCGQGHFARLWAPHLAPRFRVIGVDREARSLAVAEERCEAFRRVRGLDGSFEFCEGDAHALPFDDERFDLVIAQTVLIHVTDPERAFRELVRVTRPGGLVLVAEPNNLAGLQELAAFGPELPTEDAVHAMRLLHRCTRGKHALGLGWNHLGAQLHRLFAELDDVVAFNNDRAGRLTPPYASPEDQAVIDDLRRDDREGVYGWARAEAERYYVAGGGTRVDFTGDYDAMLAVQRTMLDRIAAGTWHALTAFALLVVAGRKPTDQR